MIIIAVLIGGILLIAGTLLIIRRGVRTSVATVSERRDLDGSASRRSFLKLVGVGSLGVVPAFGLSKLLDDVVTGKPSAGPSTPARGPKGRIRQWAMIIDLRSCDGCQSQGTPPQCTTACIEGHLAPEPMEWIEVFEQEIPGGGTQFIPTPCQQCQNPPCVNF